MRLKNRCIEDILLQICCNYQFHHIILKHQASSLNYTFINLLVRYVDKTNEKALKCKHSFNVVGRTVVAQVVEMYLGLSICMK